MGEKGFSTGMFDDFDDDYSKTIPQTSNLGIRCSKHRLTRRPAVRSSASSAAEEHSREPPRALALRTDSNAMRVLDSEEDTSSKGPAQTSTGPVTILAGRDMRAFAFLFAVCMLLPRLPIH